MKYSSKVTGNDSDVPMFEESPVKEIFSAETADERVCYNGLLQAAMKECVKYNTAHRNCHISVLNMVSHVTLIVSQAVSCILNSKTHLFPTNLPPTPTNSIAALRYIPRISKLLLH